jgi:monofunctional biosynthetic peptidoglycan transglycosylase
MIRAIIVAEDSRFYSHSGIDLEALKAAMEYNLSEKRFVYGGSTISQQTVKNIFLSPSRNPLRKWHELMLTIGMERNLSKKRILELYLNVAEFGRGIYGVEAAARFYWGIPASNLSAKQAIQLAATLPSPVNHNPGSRTSVFNNRVARISQYF